MFIRHTIKIKQYQKYRENIQNKHHLKETGTITLILEKINFKKKLQ